DEGEYYFINGNNLIEGRIQITEETKHVSYSELSDNDKALNNLTLLMSINGTIGQLAFYSNESIKLGKSVAYIRFGNLAILSFYYGVLMTSNTQQYFNRRVTGTTIKNLGLNEIRNFKYPIPNGNEQDKIGKLIKSLDTLITLQQRKLKQLNLLQRYIKEKTLPSQKELPKLRFLTTPYNTYKFSELFKKSTKKNDEQILQNHVISVASMRWGKLPKSSSEAYMKTYFIFNKGDIAYEGNRSKSYSFGRFVANDLGNGIVSHVFSVFNSKINFNLEFLKNYINSEQVMRDPLRMSTSRTTMMTNLVLKDIAKQTLMIPSKDEQDLLGSLYKITQSMIELNEKQQQELIYLKKYLLQKLFI
ncbi:MAG: restriction endonuclease subunit S, partial [Anaeroplasmataceae bacterium]|nr:restriction endonuclease subunit S [Anaeroplasmataceae bacterium]